MRVIGNGSFPRAMHGGDGEAQRGTVKLKIGAGNTDGPLVRTIQRSAQAAVWAGLDAQFDVQRSKCTGIVSGDCRLFT